MYYLKLTRWKNDGLAGFTAGSISAILVYWTNQKNEFGIKDKNDWIGHKLDVGIDAVEKSAEKTVDGVEKCHGEASKSISNHISPKKWSW